jgi:hypothetical protein
MLSVTGVLFMWRHHKDLAANDDQMILESHANQKPSKSHWEKQPGGGLHFVEM